MIIYKIMRNFFVAAQKNNPKYLKYVIFCYIITIIDFLQCSKERI